MSDHMISIVLARAERNLANGPSQWKDKGDHSSLGQRQALLVSAAVGAELDEVEEKGVNRLLDVMPSRSEYVAARRILQDVLERPKAKVSVAGSPALVGIWDDDPFHSIVLCDRGSCMVGGRSFKAAGDKLLDHDGSTAGTLSGTGLYLEEARLKGQSVGTLSSVASLRGEYRNGTTVYRFDGKGQMTVSGKNGLRTYDYRIADSRTVEVQVPNTADGKKSVEATLHLFDNSLFSARLSRVGDMYRFEHY